MISPTLRASRLRILRTWTVWHRARMPRTVPGTTGRAGSRRRVGVLAVLGAGALVLLGVVAIPAEPKAAAASSTLNQVTNFGSNPGNLAMYSYLPSGLPQGAPLVVALHGCTQSASDYFDNSGWQKYADQWSFALVFPQQNSSNNAEDCFDWYTPSDYSRGNGEAESIIQMVQYAESNYGVNPHRIYITGLSAGGGMTSDMLADYPDVFAGGAIDSGIPADCATDLTSALNCQSSNQNKTAAQWGDLARGADPGWSGPWPRVAIWQGTADSTVNPVNATEEMDQWTNVWGISQTPSSTQSLTGGTTEDIYNDSSGNPAVEVYMISGMGHGLAVNPGSAINQCGNTGTYYLNYICSSYYTALFWGLNNSASPTPSPSPTPTPTPSPSPSPTAAPCFTANNYEHTVAGRAYQSLGYTYADGSNQNMGLWNTYTVTSLEETSPGYYIIASGGC
jgi:poly(hydroxyalkanoate) depolymerase family esterase